MKNTLYEVEYLFIDELGERHTHGWRNAYFVIYDTSTVLGETIRHALDSVGDDGDTGGLDKVLEQHFGVRDNEVAYYFDRNGVEDESLWLEVQADQDCVINDYRKVKEK